MRMRNENNKETAHTCFSLLLYLSTVPRGGTHFVMHFNFNKNISWKTHRLKSEAPLFILTTQILLLPTFTKIKFIQHLIESSAWHFHFSNSFIQILSCLKTDQSTNSLLFADNRRRYKICNANYEHFKWMESSLIIYVKQSLYKCFIRICIYLNTLGLILTGRGSQRFKYLNSETF